MLVMSIASVAQNQSKEVPSIMIEDQSRYDFDETVDKLTAIILEKGWKVTITHNLQETMKKNGKEVLPVKVIELCNPGLAYQILSNDKLRDVSPMLPCRLSVFEKSDGKTYVSRMNAPAFISMIDPEAGKTILQAFKEAEEFLNSVIQ